MKLEKVVPFGRSFQEYVMMFNLTPSDLAKKILGIADGPASFNAEGTAFGYNITSIDPIYQFSCDQIETRFYQVVDHIINQVKATPNDWFWGYHKSPEDLKNNRIKALNLFLQDYSLGIKQARYQIGELPTLNLPDNCYDLALCSHFLFLYSDHYDLDFHLASIKEILRVSSELRIFPLLTLMLKQSPHLLSVIQELELNEYSVSIITVPYQLQKEGDQMLRIKKKNMIL